MGTMYNEQGLSPQAQDLHRALASLIEELEAVDWYNQRADVTPDAALKAIVIHNRNEEMEHAAMALEWIRRAVPEFDQCLKTYLFTTGEITAIEEAAAGGEGAAEAPAAPAGDLGIGRLAKGGK
ncbi:MAG TPA: ferritin-like domain-containing protein [Candidatus Sumerlaeota bacterium]|nr:ferritin-like domain-containing protein [Candidatus Sumerlaeota bacterium]